MILARRLVGVHATDAGQVALTLLLLEAIDLGRELVLQLLAGLCLKVTARSLQRRALSDERRPRQHIIIVVVAFLRVLAGDQLSQRLGRLLRLRLEQRLFLTDRDHVLPR